VLRVVLTPYHQRFLARRVLHRHLCRAILGTPSAIQPLYWLAGYIIFLGLNLYGVELSFRVTVFVTLVALAVLVIFFVSAIPHVDFGRRTLNIGIGTDGALPFAVWLFLATEPLPLSPEEEFGMTKGASSKSD